MDINNDHLPTKESQVVGCQKGSSTVEVEWLAPSIQLKEVVGGVEISTASFEKNGNFVFTQGALSKARDEASRRVGSSMERNTRDLEAIAIVLVVAIEVDGSVDSAAAKVDDSEDGNDKGRPEVGDNMNKEAN
ncbi:hypothetical protein POM88_013389 [Heracleum sosnowskyi]|uniref:Uncharacterized protein n=1 Tax=Heracleum sosnowskyi TaxID=360622 RepID=A0AAD8J0G5_9APIA|nr:hypothetical protein POM88_013389 [Heracleum sosnowskyi]